MVMALLVIDMQNFVVDRVAQGVQYSPANCINNMNWILEQFRTLGKPVLHVHHQDPDPGSALHASSPLCLPAASFEALADEPVFIKHTSSAFSSTTLLSYLQDSKISEIVVIGAVAGFCVNSTVRMGADAGLNMTVVKDAVISFELEKYHISAQEILNVTLALLEADFARVIASAELGIH